MTLPGPNGPGGPDETRELRVRRRISEFVYRTTGRVLDLEQVTDAPDVQAMVALLLAGVADSDGAITDDEFVRIIVALRRLFDLGETVSLDLYVRAVEELRSREDLSEVFAELGPRLSLKRKEDLLVAVLKVIAADGQKHPAEMAFLHRFAREIGMPEDITARAFDRYADERRNSRAPN